MDTNKKKYHGRFIFYVEFKEILIKIKIKTKTKLMLNSKFFFFEFHQIDNQIH